MISFNDFKNEKGDIDWVAYKKAQEDAGEICSRCGCYMFHNHNKIHGRRLCTDCQSIDEDKEEVSHDDYIRCPKCRAWWNPYDIEQYKAFEDGEHEICCPECDHTFEITTHVSYTFVSPALEESK